MVRLSQVLGGLLKDIVQTRVTGDILSTEYLEEYTSRGLLGKYPVPRFAIKEVNVDLRFAVQEDQTTAFQHQEHEELARLWSRRLEEKALPVILREAKGGATVKGGRHEKVQALLHTAGVDALKTVSGPTSFQADMVDSSQRPDAVDTDSDLAELVRKTVQEHAQKDLPRLRQMAAARAATNMDLDVVIESGSLAPMPENGIQSIRFVLVDDDLEGFEPQAAGSARDGDGPLPEPPWNIRDVHRIEGIGPEYGTRLRLADVRTYGDLLAIDADRLARKIGVSAGRVQRWQVMADFENVEGIDPQWAELLVKGGVRDIVDLAGRDPQDLTDALRTYLGRLRVLPVDRPVDSAEVRRWVAAARRALEEER